jgi:hypothetical protein
MKESAVLPNGDQFMRGFLCALRIVSKNSFAIVFEPAFFRAFHRTIIESSDFKALIERESIDFDFLHECYCKWLVRKINCFKKDRWLDGPGFRQNQPLEF